MFDLALIGGNVYVDGWIVHTNIYITRGTIVLISSDVKAAKKTEMVRGLYILPGFIDPHVHLDLALGSLVSADDFQTGSAAAARGGFTTLLDFLDPITHESELEDAFKKRMLKAESAMVDYSFHATLGNFKGDVNQLTKLVKSLGMNSVKVFTTYSESNRMIGTEALKNLLDEDVLTMVHAEADHLVSPEWEDIKSYESSRPLEAELEAIDRLLRLKGKGKLYVVHVSSGSGVKRLKGHPDIYIESCPHYFYYDQQAYATPEGAKFLMAPPLRSRSEMIALRNEIDAVHCIGTDHCPFKLSEKMKPTSAREVPKGVGGLPYSFLLMYNLFGRSVVPKYTENVARTFGLRDKGRIAPGYDADLTLLDPKGTTLIETDSLSDRYSLYDGMRLKGVIKGTMVRGQYVFKEGALLAHSGRFVKGE